MSVKTKHGFVESLEDDNLANVMVGAVSADGVLLNNALRCQTILDMVTQEVAAIEEDKGLNDYGKTEKFNKLYKKYTEKLNDAMPPFLLDEVRKVIERQTAAIEDLKLIKLRGDATVNEVRAREIREYARSLSMAELVAFYMDGTEEIQAAIENGPIYFKELSDDVRRRVVDGRAEKKNPTLVAAHNSMLKLLATLEGNLERFPQAVAAACRVKK